MTQTDSAIRLSGKGAEQQVIDAAAIARGISRLFARNNIWCLAEMPLRGGRRADLMGIDAKGHVIIVEIKVSRADLLGDSMWTDYLEEVAADRTQWRTTVDEMVRSDDGSGHPAP